MFFKGFANVALVFLVFLVFSNGFCNVLLDIAGIHREPRSSFPLSSHPFESYGMSCHCFSVAGQVGQARLQDSLEIKPGSFENIDLLVFF